MTRTSHTLRHTLGPRLVGMRHRHRSHPLWGALVVGWHVALAAAAGVVFTFTVETWSVGTGFLYACVTFFIGTRMRAVGNMMHECVHDAFVQGRRANLRFGIFLSLIDCSSFAAYKAEHISHHRHLGDPVLDRDLAGRRLFGFEKPNTLLAVLKYVLLPFTGWPQVVLCRPVLFSRCDSAKVTALRVLLYASITIACLLIPGLAKGFFLFYVVPYFTSYQAMKFWSDAADHAGLLAAEDEFMRSRNHILPGGKLLNALFFPRNDGYHLVHHLFPSLPTAQYPSCHSLLMELEEYRGRKHGWGIFRKERKL